MSKSALVATPVLDQTWQYLDLAAHNARQRRLRHALTSRLQSALEREAALRQEKSDLLECQRQRAVEFEHRLFNNLQLVAAQLLLQCRAATPTTAAQLSTAASRIGAFGSVHRRLNLAGRDGKVEITHHLQCLCDDLAGLLFPAQAGQNAGQNIVVEGPQFEIPAKLAVPIGLIVNELITNAAKYAKSNIVVRFKTDPPVSHSITIADDGPGFPGGFDPAGSKGLGMHIVMSLVREIGGELHFEPGVNGRGSQVTVTFNCDENGGDPRPGGMH